MPCTRPQVPQVLDQANSWTDAWNTRRQNDSAAAFKWPIVDKKPLNQHLLPDLMKMTAEHCAYCDGWPLGTTGQPTIDHFRPKSQFPDQAFQWPNLFPSCERCQGQNGKADNWHNDLLKPDATDYTFERYFRYDPSSGRLEPDPEAPAEDQTRAKTTIDLLGLNSGSRPKSRKREANRPSELPENERPFRFIFRILG